VLNHAVGQLRTIRGADDADGSNKPEAVVSVKCGTHIYGNDSRAVRGVAIIGNGAFSGFGETGIVFPGGKHFRSPIRLLPLHALANSGKTVLRIKFGIGVAVPGIDEV
jgi:hypothetical protein